MLAYTTVVIIFVCLFGGISGLKGHGQKSDNGVTARGAPTTPETLNVTLLLFSGEPDPEWQIIPSNTHYQKIQRLLESARKDGLSYGAEQIPAELGYRGILVKTASTVNAKPELIMGRETVKLQKLFLQTVPKDKNFKGIRDHVLTVIKQGDLPIPATKKSIGTGPAYKPGPWRQTPYILQNNNCYNYATDKMNTGASPGPAVPGRGGGKAIKKPYTAGQVRDAAKLDGLIEVAAPVSEPPFLLSSPDPNRHLVALLVKTSPAHEPHKNFANDFHWYRLDNNEYWSHKLGKNPPTDRDYMDQPITDPRTAIRKDKNYQFVCFMTTDPAVVKIM